MSLTTQDSDQGNSIEPRERRRPWALVISMMMAILGFAFGAYALMQRNAAIQLASTAQAASTFAIGQQITDRANAEAARLEGMTAQADAEAVRIQVKAARANELAAQSFAMQEKNFPVSMLLGLEAYKEYNTPRSMGALLDGATTYPQIQGYLNGHGEYLTAAAFSPDGITLASGSCSDMPSDCRAGLILLHDVRSNQLIKSFAKHTNFVKSLAFSPDGNRLASAGWDRAMILWDVETGQPVAESGPEMGHSVAFSPDGKILASGGSSQGIGFGRAAGSVKLWNGETGQLIEELPIEAKSITSVAFSLDGNTLAAVDFEGTAFLWDMKTRQISGKSIPGVFGDRLRFLPNGDLASIGPGLMTTWDVKNHRRVGEPIHLKTTAQTAISPDGSTLMMGERDGLILLEDLQTHDRRLLNQSPGGYGEAYNILAVSPDGNLLAVTDQQKKHAVILVKKVGLTEPLGKVLHDNVDEGAGELVISSDGRMLALGGDGTVTVLNAKTGSLIGKIWGSQFAYSVAISPDGKTVASGGCAWQNHFTTCEQAEIDLWDVGNTQPSRPLTDMENLFRDLYYSIEISSLAFSPDGNILASASIRHTNPILQNTSGHHDILLWDVKTGRLVRDPLKGHTDSVNQIVFSPDGSLLASAGRDGMVRLWDIKTGKATAALKGHISEVASVAFSPDGNTVASGGQYQNIIFWDVESGQMIGDPIPDPGYSLAFSPDGKILASASHASAVTLWDVETHQPIGEPFAKPIAGSLSASSIVYSPDGHTIASRSFGDQPLVLWDLDPQTWIDLTCQRASRNFTRAEWAAYFPGEEYRRTCPQWPLEP